VTLTGRIVLVAGMIVVAVAGCAQSGQLGSPAPAPAPLRGSVVPAVVTAPAASVATGPVVIGSGRIEDPVRVRTPGPAVFTVRTETLAPGRSTGWYLRPGTETSIVGSGTVTLLRQGRCDGTRYRAGEAVFVPDAEPHLLRNDGSVPVDLVVTSLLAPGAPERQDLPPRC
jgi:quercetin dioxygenase-like cupin family protein